LDDLLGKRATVVEHRVAKRLHHLRMFLQVLNLCHRRACVCQRKKKRDSKCKPKLSHPSDATSFHDFIIHRSKSQKKMNENQTTIKQKKSQKITHLTHARLSTAAMRDGKGDIATGEPNHLQQHHQQYQYQKTSPLRLCD
jgi:hypothetical protein